LLLRGLKDVADFLTGSALAAGFGLPIILMHTDVVRILPFPSLRVAQS
jgi:ABC-type protease/lipase transport system fused ATPase/permease subunit